MSDSGDEDGAYESSTDGDDADGSSINEQILAALKIQNDLLQRIEKKLDAQNGGSGGNKTSGRNAPPPPAAGNAPPPPAVRTPRVAGSWKFQKSKGMNDREEDVRRRVGFLPYRSTTTHVLSYGHIPKLSPLGGPKVEPGMTLKAGLFPRCDLFSASGSAAARDPSTRLLLPLLVFCRRKKGQTKLVQKSGVYALSLKFNVVNKAADKEKHEVGVVIGEIQFTNDGYVSAEGAD